MGLFEDIMRLFSRKYIVGMKDILIGILILLCWIVCRIFIGIIYY